MSGQFCGKNLSVLPSILEMYQITDKSHQKLILIFAQVIISEWVQEAQRKAKDEARKSKQKAKSSKK